MKTPVIFFFFKESNTDLHTVAQKKEKPLNKNKNKLFNKPYLIVALGCVFLTGLIVQSTATIADPHFKDNGIPLALITTVLSIFSISMSVTKFSTGLIYDRAGLRVSTTICYTAGMIALPSLLFVANSSLGIGLGVVYAIFMAVALPLQTVMLPIIVRELFGEESFDNALGIFVGVNTAGYALTPIADFIFDSTGSYDLWISICIALFFAIAVAMNIVITLSKRDRKLVAKKDT